MASLARFRTCNYSVPFNLLKRSFKKTGASSVLCFHSSSPKYVIELKMPSLSPTMTSGTIVSWHKKEGDCVNPGDVLCEIQTDKAVIAFETEEEGTLAKIIVGSDTSEIEVGSLVALLAEPGEDWKNVQTSHLSHSGVSTHQKAVQTNSSASSTQHQEKFAKQIINFGPAVRGLLDKYGLSPNKIVGTGPRGILLKGDVLQYIKEENLKPISIVSTPKPIISTTEVTEQKKVQKGEVKKVPSASYELEYKDLELSSMRRTIAKRLTASKTGIAHAYSTISCRIDSIMNLRKKFKTDGIQFSINDVIIKAVAVALDACPKVNVIWKGNELVQPISIDVSVAVATNSGLITPIVTDALGRGVQEIGSVVRDLAERARAGKLQLHEFQGGSFTISNLGMYGISEFSAIINPPQCAILAVGGSHLEIDEDGKPITVMTATLSYDEEAINSVEAATFMSSLRNLLESPHSLLLGHCSPTTS